MKSFYTVILLVILIIDTNPIIIYGYGNSLTRGDITDFVFDNGTMKISIKENGLDKNILEKSGFFSISSIPDELDIPVFDYFIFRGVKSIDGPWGIISLFYNDTEYMIIGDNITEMFYIKPNLKIKKIIDEYSIEIENDNSLYIAKNNMYVPIIIDDIIYNFYLLDVFLRIKTDNILQIDSQKNSCDFIIIKH